MPRYRRWLSEDERDAHRAQLERGVAEVDRAFSSQLLDFIHGLDRLEAEGVEIKFEPSVLSYQPPAERQWAKAIGPPKTWKRRVPAEYRDVLGSLPEGWEYV